MLPWLTREVAFCPVCWVKRLPSSADVFHGRRSKQPSPSHLELTAESVGCLHTLRHGHSLRVQGWSAPDHCHRDRHLLQRALKHMVPLPGTTKTTETYNNLGWLSKNLAQIYSLPCSGPSVPSSRKEKKTLLQGIRGLPQISSK